MTLVVKKLTISVNVINLKKVYFISLLLCFKFVYSFALLFVEVEKLVNKTVSVRFLHDFFP